MRWVSTLRESVLMSEFSSRVRATHESECAGLSFPARDRCGVSRARGSVFADSESVDECAHAVSHACRESKVVVSLTAPLCANERRMAQKTDLGVDAGYRANAYCWRGALRRVLSGALGHRASNSPGHPPSVLSVDQAHPTPSCGCITVACLWVACL